MIACRHLLGWLLSAFRSRQGSYSGKPCSSSAASGSPRPTALPATDDRAQAVLGRHAQALGSMETAAPLGHTQNRRPLASRRLSVVLEVDITSPAKRRPKAYKQGDSGVDFSDGGRVYDRQDSTIDFSDSSSFLTSSRSAAKSKPTMSSHGSGTRHRSLPG